jgi:serine/threonine protein kinase
MALSAGVRLGPYEIVAPLGAGGMGEVYRARDTKLGREVAIKIVSDGLSHDPERMARFEREAHLLAALNHPHIGGIYGLDEVNGSQFLVLELVEGETLAARLRGDRCQSQKRWRSRVRLPTPCRPRTRKASFTAISSRPTSPSPPTVR